MDLILVFLDSLVTPKSNLVHTVIKILVFFLNWKKKQLIIEMVTKI